MNDSDAIFLKLIEKTEWKFNVTKKTSNDVIRGCHFGNIA